MKKVFIKALSIMLVVVMTLTAAPLSGFVGLELPEWLDFSIKSSAATYSGTCGENLTWTYDTSTCTLTVSGTGAMDNHKLFSPWVDYERSIKNVVINYGVTSIGDYSFCNCDSLTNVTIPDSVVSIGEYAFSSCESLTHIIIPDSVISIGDYAFHYCESLTSITVDSNNRYYSSDEYGALYNREQTTLIQYPIGNSRINYTISVTTTEIGISAFYYCTNLISVTIPNKVTVIGNDAFRYCNSLTCITIPDSVTTVGNYAFFDCNGLTDITIGKNVTTIGNHAFETCDNLTCIIIPDSVTTIGKGAFYRCDALENVIIGSSLSSIGEESFGNCKNLNKIIVDDKNQYFSSDSFGVLFNKSKTKLIQFPSGSKVESYIIPNTVSEIVESKVIKWSSSSIVREYTGAFAFAQNLKTLTLSTQQNYIGDAAFAWCDSLTNVIIPDSITSIGDGAFYYCGSLDNIYYMGSEVQWNNILIGSYNGKLKYATIHYNYDVPEIPTDPGDTNNILENIVFIDVGEHYLFSAYDENGIDVTQEVSWDVINDTGEIEVVSAGDIVGVSEGLTTVYIDSYDDFCYVYVGKPTELLYESISDKIYYYGENAFYSDACQFSDSVDIYFSIENSLNEDAKFLSRQDGYSDKFANYDIGDFTIYASVDGTNLSFDKDEYINNYIAGYNNIPIAKAVDELLTLYPYNLDVSSGDKTFTVSLRIESDDFETIYDSFTFKISSLEDKAVNEHISFINNNGAYRAMRDADFATGMTDLKNDSQYIWSKYSTFDFENYYEVLMADVLVQLMGTQLTGNISLLPALKEWKENYDTILDNVSTIVEDDYTGYMDITENLLDKLFKKSKYVTQPDIINDEVRDTVIDLLGKSANTEKINKAFGAIDKTGQIIDFLDFGVNIGNDIIDYVNCVSIMNSYKNMNDEFKNVIQKVYDCIPNTDWNVKEAVHHYVNLDTYAGYTEEIVKSAINLAKNITLEAFNSLFKEQFISIFTEAIGSITLKSGVLLSSTSAFSTITTGLGAVATGATLGLCISGILCNNSGQAEEMGKVVAASAFAPYIIQTLKYYEWALKEYKDESSLKHFEIAFKLNKTLQIYSIEHTYKALEIQANSIIIKLFSNKDYPGAMADLAALKTTHENCNCCEDVSTVVVRTKTIAVKCPVNVYLYDKNGAEVVRIINNVTEYVADGITVFINGSEKYITVPANQEYDIKIIATASGTMSYSVIEYDETAKRSQIVNIDDISLIDNKAFTGNIDTEFFGDEDSYALISDGITMLPTQQISVPVTLINISNKNIELDKGDVCQLTATVSPENATDKTVYWSSSDLNIATVSENGLITAVGGGTATITACTIDGVIATCEVKIIDYVFSIQNPSRTEIRNEDGIILHARVEGKAPDGSYVRWESSNGNFDEDADGSNLKIIAKNKGWTTFTAILCDANGNELARDTVEMYSKSGFFDKIGGFFRSLFGGTKIYEN